VAHAFGVLLDKAAEVFASPAFAAGLDQVFDSAIRVLDILDGPVGRFFHMLGSMIVAALPGSERLAAIFGRMIDKFSAWIQNAIATGKFDQWISDAIEVGGELKDLLGEIIDLIHNLFIQTGGEGKNTLEEITQLLHQMNQIIADPRSHDAIMGMILLFKILAVAIGGFIASWVILAGAIGYAITKIHDFYSWLLRVLGLGASKEGTIKGVSEDVMGRARDRTISKTLDRLKIPHFGQGAILNKPTVGMVAEDGREAIIPLDKPARARELLDQAGLLGGGGMPNVDVNVWLGTMQITEILRIEIRKAVNELARSMMRQTREA
jgi:hypothetical protein